MTATTTIAATPASGPTVRRRPRRPVRIARLLGYVFLIAFAVVQLAPVLLMIMNSFKTDLEVLNHPVGWPEAFRFQNYAEIWDRADFGRYLVNSVLVTLISVAALVLIASMIAFYLARFDFPWNRALLVLFLLGLMVPLRLAVIPIFSLMKDLHLLDSLAGLMVIHVAERLSFAIFVMYGFALSVPREIEEAALVDGAGWGNIYLRIFLPLMRPALGTVAIVSAVSVWNEFFFPLVLIRSDEKRTLPLGLATVMAEFRTEWALLFAGLTIAAIPIIVLFVLMARQFIDGMTEGTR